MARNRGMVIGKKGRRYRRIDPWANLPREGMFAKVPVTLDTTDPLMRNAFKCKCCGSRIKAHLPRYKFEKWNVCEDCVLQVTPQDQLNYDNTLEIYVDNAVTQATYDALIKKHKEKRSPSFEVSYNYFTWKHLQQFVGVSMKFNDGSFFVLRATSEGESCGLTTIPYYTDKFCEEAEFYAHFGESLETVFSNLTTTELETKTLLSVSRPDLKLFNVEVKVSVEQDSDKDEASSN